MGVIAAGIASAAITVGAGIYTNRKNQKANSKAQAISRNDYQARLNAAAKMATQMQGEYEALIGERPNVSWEEFVKNKIKAIEDPHLRQVYSNAKSEDFEKLREFAKIASSDNIENLMSSADALSGGKGKFAEILAKRDELVMNTDAASRLARTYELAAPLRGGATTVKYDTKGNLVEGQRSDKQAFSVASEVQTAVEQEQKADLRSLENDRITAAASQVEKARAFMPFYDSVRNASDMEDQRFGAELAFQTADENRAWSMYEMFARQASGLTPTVPTYADPNAGNQLIASGLKSGVDAVGSYYANKPKTSAGSTNANPFTVSGASGHNGSSGTIRNLSGT